MDSKMQTNKHPERILIMTMLIFYILFYGTFITIGLLS